MKMNEVALPQHGFENADVMLQNVYTIISSGGSEFKEES